MSSNFTKFNKPPALPPKKIAPDPDYEVIEFSNEQYSNAQPVKAQNGKPIEASKCELCGSMAVKVKCDQCNQQLFCSSCDDMFHRHPKRNTHIRKAIVIQSDIKPPLPPKGGAVLLPVAPPRRKKTGMTPMPTRKFDRETPIMQRPQAPPSPALSLRERVSSIKRLIVPGNKTCTKTPQEKGNPQLSSLLVQSASQPRPETPNSDTSTKLPSLAMERIKIQTNNARGRIEIMQKRYHEYQESMKNDNGSRNALNFSPSEQQIINENRNSTNRSDSFGMRLRSGSLSNFANQMNKPSNNGRFNSNPNDFDETTQDEGSLSDTRSRAFSSSVHDLNFGRNNPNNQWPHAQQQFSAPFGYMPNQYHGQMQLSCVNCSQQQLWNPQMMEPQWHPKNLNGSNMSLNLPQGGFYPQSFGTTWMNNGSYQKPDPYSYPFGMMPYNNGYPQPMSRPHSRVPSRAASPACSTKSRKSSISTRNINYRNSYIEPHLNDDESSDSMGYVDDLNREKLNRRFSMEQSMRPRHMTQSSPQKSYDEESEAFSRRKQNSHGRRASSSARSISSRSERRPSQGIRSDSTQDSEVEFGTRALVQAKIREKVAQASSNESSIEISKSKVSQKDLKKPAIQPVSNVNKIEKYPLKQSERKSVDRNVQRSSSAVQTEAPKKKESPPKTSETPKSEDDKKESEADLTQTLSDDAPSGPPPSTPDYEWECEFCTFTNEPKTKICAICCKTPTTKAVRKSIQESKPVINGRASEQAEISKEGFWVVSTSEDDVSELQSDEINPEEFELDKEKDINDLEVMNILSQIETLNGNDHIKNDVIIEDIESCESALSEKDADEPDPFIGFIDENNENRIKLEDQTQNDTIHSETIQTKDEMRTQNTANTSSSPIQEQSNPQNTTNEIRKPFDAELLAYIDQSLKTLIGANSNNNNNNNHPIQNTAFPYLSPPIFMNNTGPPMQVPQMAFNSTTNGQTSNDMHLYKVLLGANNYSYDEIQVALASCPNADPIIWLNDNWQKLIETVQTLSTKYGQEHKKNIVGTISPIEAREALKKHKGNVWHAVTECIENRQSAFSAIKSQGNYSSEDVVTYLTAHNGNLEKALEELNRVQMKPFLLKILNSPAIQEIEASPKVEQMEPILASVQDESSKVESKQESQTRNDTTQEKNDEKNILKDIEAIIGSMEEKQSKQTEAFLQTIETLVGNLNTSHISRSMSSASSFSVASSDRIDMKSPIVMPSRSFNNVESNSDVENDVKHFVSRHIQDIVPDVAALMNKELTENSTNTQKSGESYQQSKDNPLNEIDMPERNDDSQAITTIQNAPDTQVTDFEQIIVNEESTSVAIQSDQPVLDESQFEEMVPSQIERTPMSYNGAKFTVNSLYPRLKRNQMERNRIRKLEKQRKKRQRRQSIINVNHIRSDSQNTGYLTDATITPEIMGDPQTIEINPVSNEKTFSLSIVEQAIVDNNKEQPIVEPDVIPEPGNVDTSNEKDLKSRNLSELVEDTKNLIQQMKFEINEDIAMSASEFEFDGDDMDNYTDDGSFDSEYSDSWEDIDDEEEAFEEEFSDHSENELFGTENQNSEYHERSSQSIESEYFSEFDEHVNRAELQFSAEVSVDNLLDEINVTNDENLMAEEQSNIEILPSSPSANEDRITEHMIEIQQSLHTSNVVSLSIREDAKSTNREKSASFEPTEAPIRGQSVEKSNSVILREENGFEKIEEDYDNSEASENANIEQPITHNQNFDGQEITNVDDNSNGQTFQSSEHEDVIVSEEQSHTETSEEIHNSHESHNSSFNEKISEQSALQANKSTEELETENNKKVSKSTSSQDIVEEPMMNANDTGSEIDELSADISHASASTTTDESSSTDNASTHSSVSLAPSETLIESFKYKKITVPVVSQCSQSSINVMQLQKIELNNKSTPVKNKIPVRRPSFGEPSASIRNIQNELMNKQLRQPTLKINKKPSKIVPPKLFFKSSFGVRENHIQFNNGAATKKPDDEIPSTSSGHQSIPKKKYYETCFSDDYQTSDDESRPSSSKKVIPNLVKILETNPEESFDIEIMVDRLLQDGNVQNYSEAALAAKLIQMKFREDKALWAATQCKTIEEALDILQQECELCMETFPMNRIVFMLKCDHSCCEDCAKNYFTIQITDRSITDCTCPFCKLPDLNASEATEDDALEYFSNMDILLKSILDETVHELFQRKLRDRTLMQDPNFKWCIQCSSGFFARSRQKKLICPDCGSITCAQCRKTWESQHEGITCDQFSEWKDSNDPENQAQGVANHLQLHGISCPKCKFKYSLARGGCMHFTCTQCKYEFCYGCNKPFKMGAKCKVSDYCSKLGLHSHHPRNCLFYLRDKEPSDLQTLLRMHDVPFNTEPLDFGVQPENTENFEDSPSSRKLCPMPVQRETPGGFIDTVCKGDIELNSAGLCRTHFVEYLVGIVAKANIDPLPILDLTDCVQELRRSGIALPDRGPWDTDPIYRDMCSKIVEKHIPLD